MARETYEIDDLHRLRLIRFHRENEYKVFMEGELLGMAVDPIAAVVAAKVNLYKRYKWGTYRVVDDRTDNIVERGFIRRVYDVKEGALPWILFSNLR